MKNLPLNPHQILAIRLCKSNVRDADFLRRMRKIIGWHCALYPQHVDESHVVDFVLGIVEQYELTTLREFARGTSNDEVWKCGDEIPGFGLSCNERIARWCMSKLRLTSPRRVWKNYKAPTGMERRFAEEHSKLDLLDHLQKS